MRLYALRGTLLGGVTAGKWDRFATFGEKVQDGQEFSFTVETFGQMVQNFARFYSGRRLGMDFEHQAINAAQNGQAAPNLAYYNALAVVAGGKVAKFYAQQPDVSPPDPAALLIQLRERFPDLDSADGLWGYRCEVTPLGQQLLPGYEQISPLFTSDGTDEGGNPIGYHLMNVSAVNVAFQDGTVLNLSRALAIGDSSLHVPGPLQSDKGAKMADDDKKKDAEDKPSALRSECMKKLGLPEDASDDAMYGALMAQKFGDLLIEHKEEEKEKTEGMGKMDAAPPADMPAAMSKIVDPLIRRLEAADAERVALGKKLEQIETEKHTARVTAFKKFAAQYVDDAEADEYLSAFGGDCDKAEKFVARLPKKAVGIYGRFTEGGKPHGAVDVQGDLETVTPQGNPTVGLSVARQARAYAEQNKVPLKDAYKALSAKLGKRSPLYG